MRFAASQSALGKRRGAVVILVAILLIAFMGMVSFAIDIGYVATVQTQLQRAADAAALAAAGEMNRSGINAARTAAQHVGELNSSSAAQIDIPDANVEFGIWDLTARTFTPSAAGKGGNAVRVRIQQQPNLFFARAMGVGSTTVNVEAIAIATPRDICFVVDLSGSMNDDTEPCWATSAINSSFASSGYSTIGNDLMTKVYEDFDLGSYPGTNEQIGKPLGSFYQSYNQWAYAELTKDAGPLAASSIASQYRITSSDSEATRKSKAYKWMIDNQIARLIPNARPAPTQANYAFWQKYIDYVIVQKTVNPPAPSGGGGSSGGGGGGGSSGGSGGGTSTPPPPPPPSPPKIGWLEPVAPLPTLEEINRLGLKAFSREPVVKIEQTFGTRQALLAQLLPAAILSGYGQPPDSRGSIPPGVDSQTKLVGKFNNPNTTTYPSATAPNAYRNLLGPQTYVQFLMDHGRDLQVNSAVTPLSADSPNCPWHSEATDGGTFSFPPREQPSHACRRSMIAAMAVIKTLNSVNPSPEQRDWVSIVTFDKASPAPAIAQSLTSDYDSAMLACTRLQAVGDRNASTATEAGLIKAQEHLKPTSQGGAAREFSDKVVVLLTDGVPNLTASSSATISSYQSSNPDSNWYGGGYDWLDGPIMQAMQMEGKGYKTYPVGLGLGTDYDFMDRMARVGATADENGQSPRGSGNPAEYEQRLKQIFQDIIANAGVRLVH